MRSGRLSRLGTSIAILAVALAGCGTARGPAPGSLADVDAGYDDHIGPGDQIQLRVWREPDMSGEFMVDRDGTVVLPRVGRYDVRGETVTSLADSLLTELRVHLRNPSIEVRVLRRIRVLGHVNQPGLYRVDPTMSIGDALALAGGVAESGRDDEIELIRDGRRFLGDLTQQTRLGDVPLHSGDALFVPERHWLMRNYGFVLSGLSTLVVLISQIDWGGSE